MKSESEREKNTAPASAAGSTYCKLPWRRERKVRKRRGASTRGRAKHVTHVNTGKDAVARKEVDLFRAPSLAGEVPSFDDFSNLSGMQTQPAPLNRHAPPVVATASWTRAPRAPGSGG